MANKVYPLWMKKVVEGNGPFWAGALWKAVLVDVSYVYDDAHEFLSSIAGGDRVATSAVLSSVAVLADGVINADPAEFAAFTGADAPSLVVYHDTVGADSLKELALFFDDLTGLPVHPANVPVTMNWNTGADKIARL